MRAIEIARVNLVRLIRDRTSLFFVFLLPIVLIVVLGVIYGGRVAPRLGIVSTDSGALGADLVAALRSGEVKLEIKEFGTEADLRDAVERGTIELGIVIPPDYDATMRTGGTAEVTVVSQPGGTLAMQEAVAAAVANQSAQVRAARLAVERGGEFESALARAREVQQALPGVDVAVVDVGDRLFPTGAGMFSLGAQSQLVLFMFLTSMTAATQLILTRQFGVSRRMFSTPTSSATIVAGETLGRFGVAMVQGVFIVLLSALVFGVSWGDPLGASLLVIAFALTGTGFAMLIGTFATNADQAGTFGVFGGMLLGFLGGAMVPLEVFGEPLRTIAQFTPHAWAIQGLRALAFDGAGPAGIAPQLAVLLAFGLVPLAIATWRFRRMLAGG
jgi:ABC-2 type transport system permease protein